MSAARDTASAARPPRIEARGAPPAGRHRLAATPRLAPCAASDAATGAGPRRHVVSSHAATTPPTGPGATDPAPGPLSRQAALCALNAHRSAERAAKIEALRTAVAEGRTVAAAARHLDMDAKYAAALAAQHGIKADPAVISAAAARGARNAHAKRDPVAAHAARMRAAIAGGVRGVRDLCTELNLSPSHLKAIAKRHQVDIPPQGRTPHPLAAQMRALVEEGCTVKEAARRLRINTDTGQKIAQRYHIVSSVEARAAARARGARGPRPNRAPPAAPNPHRTDAQNANVAQMKQRMWWASRGPLPPPSQADADAAVRAYLDRGGAITVCPPGDGYIELGKPTARPKSGLGSGGQV